MANPPKVAKVTVKATTSINSIGGDPTEYEVIHVEMELEEALPGGPPDFTVTLEFPGKEIYNVIDNPPDISSNRLLLTYNENDNPTTAPLDQTQPITVILNTPTLPDVQPDVRYVPDIVTSESMA